MKKIFVALAAASALTVAGALPASATTVDDYYFVVGDWNWQIGSYNGGNASLDESYSVKPENGVNDYSVYTIGGVDYDAIYGDTLDGAEWGVWNGTSSYQPQCDSADSSIDADTGDLIITCTDNNGWDTDGNSSSDVDTTVEYRIFDDGYNGALIRYSLILTNNTDNNIPFGWDINTSFGECGEGLTSTGNGDQTWDLEDGWVQCAADGHWSHGGEAAVTYAYGYADGAVDFPESAEFSNTQPDDDNDFWSDEDADGEYSSIPAASTIVYSVFYFGAAGADEVTWIVTADEEAAFAALSADTFGSGLSSRLAAGLPSTPLNWAEAAPAEEDLASTGTDVTGTLALGGSALIVGAIAMIVRRRRTV